MSKKISIIIPVYNTEKYIERAVQSLINQSYKNLEIILINDGSTDDSLKKCQDLSRKDKRIIIIDKKNSGVSSSRNAGIEKATGEYITFIDSDDYIELNAYEECMKVLEKHDVDFLKFSYYKESKNIRIKYNFKIESEKKIDISNKGEFLKEIFYSKDFEGIWNLIVKRSLLDKNKIKFDEKLIVAEDFRFMCECIRYANNIFMLNKPFYHYIINYESVTQKYNLEKLLIRCDNIIKSYIESTKTIKIEISNNPYCIQKILNQLNIKLSLIAEKENYKTFKKSVAHVNELESFKEIRLQGGIKNIPNNYIYYLKLKCKNIIKTIVKKAVYR